MALSCPKVNEFKMFRTIVDIKQSTEKISYQDKILTFGSCFAESIGQRLSDACLLTDINPFGVLFNPVSIRKSIQLLLQNKHFNKNDLFLHGSLWNSFSHSTKFSSDNQEKTLQLINDRFEKADDFLKKGKYLMITFGTAWVYENTKTKEVVSNCHKLPASNFIRKKLHTEDIISDYIQLLKQLHLLNPNLRIILTVSPIRHWKDGAHENNVSKSTLLLATDHLTTLFPFVEYFPAYEILLDELRDYRFYDEDMFHPSDMAVNYIWQRFIETYFTPDDQKLIAKVEQLNKDLQHRFIHPDIIESKNFALKVEEKKAALKKEFPFLKDRI
jgi:hypothetical protein